VSEDCAGYRNRIPEWVLGDLAPEAAREFEGHVGGCAACSLERAAFEKTLGRMRRLEDEDPPRHFFAYPAERRLAPWRAFASVAPAWQALFAAVMLLMIAGGGMALARLNLRLDGGALTLSFGPLAERPAPAAVDLTALEARILKTVMEKNRIEATEWVNSLRGEISRAQARLTARERASLLQALEAVDVRMNTRLQQAAVSLQDRNDRSIAGVYEAVSLERERLEAAVDARLSRLASSTESRNNQTDSILESLLQVAELRTRQ
jgi:hypothetical protein